MKKFKKVLYFVIIAILVFSVGPIFSSFAATNSKIAFIRLEDISPWYAMQENGLDALKWVADYLYSQGVPFHVSVIPVYKDPSRNIYLDMGDPEDPRMKEFRDTIRYIQSGGGVVGIHGYTHQYNGKTALDYEFGISEEASTDSYASERIDRAINVFKNSGISFYYWETPHYKASQNQYKVFAKNFSLLFEPDYKNRGNKQIKVYYDLRADKKPVYFFPAPQDMVHNQDDVDRILTSAKEASQFICFFFHPFMEFSGVYYDGEPGKAKFVIAKRNGYLEQLISGIKSYGYKFTTIIQYIGEKLVVLKINEKNFTVNNEPHTLDSPPVIKNSRTLLPIRAVVEALGGSVSWDATERKVTVSLGSTTIELWIGKNTAKVNDVDTPIDSTNSKVVPEIIKERTMLPLRFVTENLGCDVQWDGTTKTITITYPKS